ncbi:MAG: flagellar hook-basal body complex subunit FliE [Actinomycetia bacterium]|nr:flagellar hook-basal body complex subunit FliE [Actinomycetes bacterium]
MTIPAISGLGSLPSITSTATKAAPDAAESFGNMITKGLDNLQQTQATADNLATQAATGDLTDLHDYMIASTQASLTTELTVSVRNKAVDAFNEIMRMQI